MSKIKFNKDTNRWELLDNEGVVLDYAAGKQTDSPWNLTWNTITVTAGGSVDTTATEGDILSGETAVVRGKKIVGTMPNKGDFIYTPSASGISKEGGYYKSIYVEGDSDLIPTNIKEGISIFGVDGTLKEGTTAETYAGMYVVTPAAHDIELETAGKLMANNLSIVGDPNLSPGNIKAGETIFNTPGEYTSDATATGADILYGKTAYAGGIKVTGEIINATINTVANTMTISEGYVPEYTEVTFDVKTPQRAENLIILDSGWYAEQSIVVGTVMEATTITPSTSEQVIEQDTYLAGDITIAGDPNLSPENIKAGETIFGVIGEYSGAGSSDVAYGYIDASGNFQPLDLSGDDPVMSGTPESMASLDMFKIGVNEPSYSSGGDSGSETASCVTAGTANCCVIVRDIYGTCTAYTPIDTTATGTARCWYRSGFPTDSSPVVRWNTTGEAWEVYSQDLEEIEYTLGGDSDPWGYENSDGIKVHAFDL